MSSESADYADGNPALAYFNIPKRGGLLVKAGPVFWILFCGAVLIAAIAVGTSVVINNYRDRALQSSQRELDNTALKRTNSGHLSEPIFALNSETISEGSIANEERTRSSGALDRHEAGNTAGHFRVLHDSEETEIPEATRPILTFREREGTTLVVRREEAERLGLAYQFA